jgi:hypothetical protein
VISLQAEQSKFKFFWYKRKLEKGGLGQIRNLDLQKGSNLLLVSLFVRKQTFRTGNGRRLMFFGFVVFFSLQELVDAVLSGVLT